MGKNWTYIVFRCVYRWDVANGISDVQLDVSWFIMQMVFSLNGTPSIKRFCRSFHVVIHLWWYCGQYLYDLPCMSSLCTSLRLHESCEMGCQYQNCHIAWFSWWNLTVAKQIKGTIVQLTTTTSIVIRPLIWGCRYGVYKNYQQ